MQYDPLDHVIKSSNTGKYYVSLLQLRPKCRICGLQLTRERDREREREIERERERERERGGCPRFLTIHRSYFFTRLIDNNSSDET